MQNITLTMDAQEASVLLNNLNRTRSVLQSIRSREPNRRKRKTLDIERSILMDLQDRLEAARDGASPTEVGN